MSGLDFALPDELVELRERATLAEFTLDQRAPDIAERFLALQPSVLGLGGYIWNVAEVLADMYRRPKQ